MERLQLPGPGLPAQRRKTPNPDKDSSKTTESKEAITPRTSNLSTQVSGKDSPKQEAPKTTEVPKTTESKEKKIKENTLKIDNYNVNYQTDGQQLLQKLKIDTTLEFLFHKCLP